MAHSGFWQAGERSIDLRDEVYNDLSTSAHVMVLSGAAETETHVRYARERARTAVYREAATAFRSIMRSLTALRTRQRRITLTTD